MIEFGESVSPCTVTSLVCTLEGGGPRGWAFQFLDLDGGLPFSPHVGVGIQLGPCRFMSPSARLNFKVQGSSLVLHRNQVHQYVCRFLVDRDLWEVWR